MLTDIALRHSKCYKNLHSALSARRLCLQVVAAFSAPPVEFDLYVVVRVVMSAKCDDDSPVVVRCLCRAETRIVFVTLLTVTAELVPTHNRNVSTRYVRTGRTAKVAGVWNRSSLVSRQSVDEWLVLCAAGVCCKRSIHTCCRLASYRCTDSDISRLISTTSGCKSLEWRWTERRTGDGMWCDCVGFGKRTPDPEFRMIATTTTTNAQSLDWMVRWNTEMCCVVYVHTIGGFVFISFDSICTVPALQ